MSVPLQVEGLTRILEGRAVVDGVDLEVGEGRVTCLLGPSGCGKSTTLRIIAGVDRQDAGVVRLAGKTVADSHVHEPPEARGVGLMFQDFALFPHLTAARNVGFGLRGKDDARVADLLDRVGLAAHAVKYPHQLSGGEQQRVALARALAPKPRVLLMDEPFSGLDNRLRDGIRDATLDVLREEGTAVLLVTHEPDEAMRMGDEIALMRGGRIVQRAAPYNIYNQPVDRDAAAFFSDINCIEGEVHGALTQTPFGQFLTPGLADGTAVDIVFRPQHVRLDFDREGRGPAPTPTEGTPARAHVVRARFMGKESLVDFRTEIGDALVTATVPAVFLPKKDLPMWLSIRRDRCFVFPRGASAHDPRIVGA
ncbi:ABC transporter ATP-binding protein [Jannaschia aquimarina]|uniref:FbpC protein n=1 Tax=Jannaschia aquimarina TaxID=935700 RepID=A0A0D1EJB7_9RHOB|nr:ABC transporter ATP-binding protein [Jannaschia aquimarina]KIT15905.1 Fe(3+) ions import ATP-binding protein FbpC [Jannaschia aquimarina]SNS97481.1 iron(III) transport system ATP-binding protein [Jannaschia aquimarina]